MLPTVVKVVVGTGVKVVQVVEAQHHQETTGLEKELMEDMEALMVVMAVMERQDTILEIWQEPEE